VSNLTPWKERALAAEAELARLKETENVEASPEADSLITPEAAEVHAGLSKTERWRRGKAGEFPKPIVLGPKCKRYSLKEIRAWVEERKSERGKVAKDDKPRSRGKYAKTQPAAGDA
jgi:predicted DNA-binding transcriptional regulator AlpA